MLDERIAKGKGAGTIGTERKLWTASGDSIEEEDVVDF